MTTDTAARPHREYQPSSPAPTGGDFSHLSDDLFLDQFTCLAYQSANTSEEESTDQMATAASWVPFLELGHRTLCVEYSALAIDFIKLAKWWNRTEQDIFFNHPFTSVLAEPAGPTKYTIIGADSAPPFDVRYDAQSSAETATDIGPTYLNAGLSSKIEAMFGAAGEETFADGMVSNFASTLHSLVRKYGIPAIDGIDEIDLADRFGVEVAGEALRQIGSVADPESYGRRLQFLLRGLESPDPRLRDATSIGIASMDDPEAIEAVTRALEQERSPQLRQNLQLLLDQLQATLRCHTS